MSWNERKVRNLVFSPSLETSNSVKDQNLGFNVDKRLSELKTLKKKEKKNIRGKEEN